MPDPVDRFKALVKTFIADGVLSVSVIRIIISWTALVMVPIALGRLYHVDASARPAVWRKMGLSGNWPCRAEGIGLGRIAVQIFDLPN